ncbi:FAD-dependent oxidoreductase [bacterium]|nr:FAD-dependent oxidoreductase [bacterium]MBU2600510.1 FAD-dependent oxidoreductase [bacterium]
MAIVIKIRKRDLTKIGLRGGRETSTLRPKYTPKTPPCTFTCPSGIDIRGYLTTISQSEGYKRNYAQSFEMGWYILVDKNPFPAVCGRVCPHPCEKECNRKELTRQEKDEAVSINNMERFIGDYGIKNNLAHKRLYPDIYPEKVAVIGSGPSGLSCAYQLARRGYRVTIFETYEKSGGMLRYGIPRYRLSEDILDAEINKILALGVEIKYNTRVGNIEQLQKEYNAIYVAIGAHQGLGLNIPGEDVVNVFTGADYLNKINSGQQVELGNKVLVIGGGNSAIDAARVARRQGADVTILYRRTKVEMPAIAHEVNQAEEEGIHLELLVAPVEVLRKGNKAVGLKCIRMELGEPDESGRRKPIPIAGSEFTVDATAIIAAISQSPVWTGLEELKNEKGWITVDERGQTGLKGVFAGGDVTNQLGLATEAIGLGRKAAETMDNYLRERELAKIIAPTVIRQTNMNLNYYDILPRTQTSYLAPAERVNNFNEVAFTIDESAAITETKRCLSCGLCFDCDNCYTFCSDSAVKKQPKGQHYEFNLALCQGCKKCAEECPCGYIDML